MTIRHQCEGCGSVLKIKDELAGKPGKCPKCKAQFIVGKSAAGPSDDDMLPSSDSSAELPTSPSPAPADDEDDMFGKDFFKLQQPVERPRFTMPTFDDDHVIPDDDEPASKPAKSGSGKAAPKANKSEPAEADAAPSNVDSAAAIASKLLAKTGKKNKTPEMEALEAKAEEDSKKVDYSELKYLVTHKILPYGAGAVVLVTLLYLLMSSMLSEGSKIPPLGNVKGVVTLQGKPVPNAEVRFQPVSKDPGATSVGSFSYGWSDANGTYEMHYNPEHRGAAVGMHRVTVTVGGVEYQSQIEVKSGSNDIPLTFQ